MEFKVAEQVSVEAVAKLGGRESDYHFFNEGELISPAPAAVE